MKQSFLIGIIALAAFVAWTFVASPELRAFAANTVGSSDIVNESILSADFKNGEVKASDIATDAAGAAELQGVTKFLFGQCILTSSEATANILTGGLLNVDCNINGVDADANAIATLNEGSGCFTARQAYTGTNNVKVSLVNDCSVTDNVQDGANISILVYDK